MKDNLTQKTFKGFFWQFGGAIFKTVIQLAVLFVLARLISKAEFGIVQSALIVIGLAQLVSQMGVGPALVQKSNLTELHIRTGATLTFILSIFFFIIVFLTSGLLAGFFKMPELKDVLKVVSLVFILEGISTVSQSLLLREMKQRILVRIDIISYTIGFGVFTIILAYYGYGLWSLVYGQLLQSLLKCILSYVKSRHSITPFFGKKEAKDLLYFGGGFTLAKLFNYLANQGDNIIAGRYLGAAALGVYSRAYSIMVNPVTLIGTSIDNAVFPAMAARQNQRDKLVEAFINGLKMINFLCIPISCVIIFSAKEIVSVMLGDKWTEVIIPLQVLTIGLVFRMGYKMGDSLSRATGNVYSRAKRQFVYALCVIAGCYFGSNWGVTGVSVGTLFAITVNYILMIHLSITILQINWAYLLKRTLSELYISLFLSVLFLAIIFLVRVTALPDLLILLISYGLCGISAVILFYFFSKKLSFIEILPFQKVIKKITR
ncbi:MAG: lipopolysaccharide biosynthesis protein [Chitinophagaceae bacterium]|nr:lipopolysaccharide biosynthesis protein [Chitinophagaceae bacterium]